MKNTRLSLWSVAPLLALCCLAYSQGSELLPAEEKDQLTKPPQGLRRLAGRPAEPGGTVIPASAISIVDIGAPQVEASAGRIASRGNIRYLALPPGAEWSTSLRPLRAGVNYTTFTMLASLDTIVSVDGALVSLVKSYQPGYATVVVGYPKDDAIEWVSLDHHVGLRPYGGQPMGTLAVITICTDTESRQWSILLLDQVAAYDLPLGQVEPGAPRVLSVKAGPSGAWVCGVANSDENPVFDDGNHNGVRDSFETTLLGAPLARHASRRDRDALVNLWKLRFELQPGDYAPKPNGARGPEWKNVPGNYFLEIPYSDPAPPEPDGRQVRGIPGSAIFNGPPPRP